MALFTLPIKIYERNKPNFYRIISRAQSSFSASSGFCQNPEKNILNIFQNVENVQSQSAQVLRHWCLSGCNILYSILIKKYFVFMCFCLCPQHKAQLKDHSALYWGLYGAAHIQSYRHTHNLNMHVFDYGWSPTGNRTGALLDVRWRRY